MTQAQIWTAVLSALGSTLGAFAAVKFAFGRFRNERLWDARYRQITEILDAVHQIEAAAEYRRATLAHEPTRRGGTGSDGESRSALARITATGGLLLEQNFIVQLHVLDFELFMSDHVLGEVVQGEDDPHRIASARLTHAAAVKTAAATSQQELQKLARAIIGAGQPWHAKLTQFPQSAYSRYKARRVDNSKWLDPSP